MGKCSFENGKCSVECKKYSMCAYMSVQRQLENFQSQIGFIYTTLKDIIDSNNKLGSDIIDLDNKLMIFTTDMLDLYNKESKKDEEKD